MRDKNANKELSYFNSSGHYIYRYEAEENPAFQQLIPYVVIRDLSKEKFYISKRIKGDDRLQGKLSIGFGGHLSPEDCYGEINIIYSGLKRELSEEVYIDDSDITPSFLGYVRDLSGSTSDHLGFVFTVETNNVFIKEDDALQGQWMMLSELVDRYYEFENWGRYIIDYFYENSFL